MSEASGLSRSTLLYYDSIGLLCPGGRSGSGYRLYSEADSARLERILAFRDMGLPLEKIKEYLDAPGADSTAMLVRRIAEMNEEIKGLRKQQQMVLDLMEADGRLKGAKDILETMTELGRQAGIGRGEHLKFHQAFEEGSPQAHRRLLGFLGFNEEDIARLLAEIAKKSLT